MLVINPLPPQTEGGRGAAGFAGPQIAPAHRSQSQFAIPAAQIRTIVTSSASFRDWRKLITTTY